MYHKIEFEKHTQLIEKYKSNAYMLWVLGLYLDEPDLDSLATRSLTDGSNDKCIDFLEIDKTGQKIIIAQGYYSEKISDKAPSKKASDLNIAASWLSSGKENAKTINEKLRNRVLECKNALDEDDIDQIEFLYIHNRPESVNTKEELETCEENTRKLFKDLEVQVTCKELGLEAIEELYRERSSQILVNDTILIDGKKMGDPITTADWDAHLFTVKGSWLRNLYKEHDDRLFSANYRGFLGISKRKKINSAIKNTAEKQPDDFLVFNNGITILTNKVTSSKGKVKLQGISIINGAQTTGALGSIDTSVDLTKVNVMCRVVMCKNPNKIDEIVKYNNTQNKITTWDQYANDEIQARIKEQFSDIGYDYSIKRGFESADAPIGIEKVAQPVLAFNGFYTDANRSKNSIFDSTEIYKRAFNERSARHILLAYCFSRSIDEVKQSLASKVTRTEKENEAFSLFNYLSFRHFLLACVGACLQQFIGGSFSPSDARINKSVAANGIDDIASNLQSITRNVLRSVSLYLYKKQKSDNTDISSLLKKESTLADIKSELTTFIESIIEENPNIKGKDQISVEKN